MADRLGPEGWAITLTKMLDQVFGAGPERYPVNVEALALQYSAQRFPDDRIKKVVSDDLEGCEGALIPSSNGKTWGILYDRSQRPERARFTIAHEFGHYLLHREANPNGFQCGEDDVSRRDGKGAEKEADTFAAYLLMPLHDFRSRIPPDHKPTIDELSACAERYGVSLTAAILRWLEYTNRRALMVQSREGYAIWAKSSDAAFKSRRYIRTRGVTFELPTKSRAVTGPLDETAKAGIPLAAGVWFDEPVEELSISTRTEHVLTLLHLDKAEPRYWGEADELEDTFDRMDRNR